MSPEARRIGELRRKLAAAFIKALLADFEKHGAETIGKARRAAEPRPALKTGLR